MQVLSIILSCFWLALQICGFILVLTFLSKLKFILHLLITLFSKNICRTVVFLPWADPSNVNFPRIVTSKKRDSTAILKSSTERLLNRVPCVSAWSMCPRANVQNACQHFIFTCQLANVQKSVPIFQLYFKRKYFSIFQLWLTFANFKNIWAILENLSREQRI